MTGPDTKYMMQWCGEWCPVTYMLDAFNTPTTNVLRAAKVVLYVKSDTWIATVVSPGEIVERFDRDQNVRDWEYIS